MTEHEQRMARQKKTEELADRCLVALTSFLEGRAMLHVDKLPGGAMLYRLRHDQKLPLD